MVFSKLIIHRHNGISFNFRRFAASTQPDRVSSLGDSGKRALCAEVIGHLLGNELAELLGKADRAEPLLAQMYPAFIPRLIRIGGLGISKKMWYCSARNYKKTGTGNVGQIDGFFCAGSPIHRDRAYVLRPTEPNANEVVPVVELNNW